MIHEQYVEYWREDNLEHPLVIQLAMRWVLKGTYSVTYVQSFLLKIKYP